jgi:cobaltochelatase CobT
LVLVGSDSGYRIFTTAYDREVDAASLARKELLKEYRERLDHRIAGSGVNFQHLARDLKALLAVPARDGWDSGQEEGLIDGRRLAQLVSSPLERRLFRSERQEPLADCLVSLLIDCSGSMKEHSESVAMLADMLVRALEQAGVASEVLGFTTNAWNGGRARTDWLRAGRPAHPGRLNEACHIVFKNADLSWRRARPNIAALLKADLFREGLDGEALAWAMQRSGGRSEERKLLIVVSDGSPMDSATHLANDVHYLDHHLKDSVAQFEQQGAEIYGLGVGLDLSPYYSRSHVLDLSAGVGTAVLREIVEMVGSGRQR